MKNTGIDWQKLDSPEIKAKLAEDRALTQLMQMKWANLGGTEFYFTDKDMPKAVIKTLMDSLVDTGQALGMQLFNNNDQGDVLIRLNGDALVTAFRGRVEQHEGNKALLKASGLLDKQVIPALPEPQVKAPQVDILIEPSEEWTKREYGAIIKKIYREGVTEKGERTELTLPLTASQLREFIGSIPKDLQDKLDMTVHRVAHGNSIVSMNHTKLSETAAKYGVSRSDQPGSGMYR